MRATIILALLLAAGCASAPVDQRSQDDWQRCQQKIQQAQCPETADPVFGALTCTKPLADKYIATPSSQRRAWLVRHGCPSEMVY